MAGKTVVRNILDQNAKSLQTKSLALENKDDKPTLVNGNHEQNNSDKPEVPSDVDALNPVAAIQVLLQLLINLCSNFVKIWLFTYQ